MHSKRRAEERYCIINFNPISVLNDIRNDKCELEKTDLEKYSQTFIVKYFNKYIRVVTDYNVTYVKTVLPLENNYNLINKLIQKKPA